MNEPPFPRAQLYECNAFESLEVRDIVWG